MRLFTKHIGIKFLTQLPLLFMLLILPKAYAETFQVHITNKSKIAYKKFELLIMPVGFGFDASQGQLEIPGIGPHEEKITEVEVKYPNVPLSVTPISADESNLDIAVIAVPSESSKSTQSKMVQNVLEHKSIIEVPGNSGKTPLVGLHIPEIDITLEAKGDISINVP